MKTGNYKPLCGLYPIGLYPTFKEWKRVKAPIEDGGVCFGLYPTFKEWKPVDPGQTDQTVVVYILPLRNENI